MPSSDSRTQSIPGTLQTDPGDDHWARRTRTDAKGLLLELARALRGFSFYGETAPERRRLLDRAYRAVVSELERAGSLEFRLGEGSFEIAGIPQPVALGDVLGPLESVLREHGLERVRLDPLISHNALHGFFELLGQPASRFEDPTAFMRSLEARDARGIQLNDIADDGPATTPKLSTTPPRASASLAATAVGDAPAPAHPTLESHPLETPSASDSDERLRARLIELDRTTEDSAYRRRAADIAVWAHDLFDRGRHDECYRALLVVADHAVGSGGRTETQARLAAACFTQIANGECLDDLIVRATGSNAAGVRAAQLLLQLGASAVPTILDHICKEGDPDRARPLHSLVLALGDESLPALIKAIENSDARRARIGIQLAGELQNPAALPVLLAALRKADVSRRDQIVRALALLPGEDSKRALAGTRAGSAAKSLH
jgi:hypothetical protein